MGGVFSLLFFIIYDIMDKGEMYLNAVEEYNMTTIEKVLGETNNDI